MNKVQIRFLDSVVTPWRKFNSLISEHPLALNEGSNAIVAGAQSLAVNLNHFRENNPETGGSKFLITDDLRNFANSIKHDKGAETRVSCWMALTYECANEQFRFIRNEVICRYETARGGNKDREFLASNELWAAIKGYADVLGVNVSKFAPIESNYGYLPVAVAFSRPEYAAYTGSVRLMMFRRSAVGFERFQPTAVKFVVLDEDAIGSDLSKRDWNFVRG